VWFSWKDLILDLIVFSVFLLEPVLDLSDLFSCCSYFGLVSAVWSGDCVSPAVNSLAGLPHPRRAAAPFSISSSRSWPHRPVRVSSSRAQVSVFFFRGQLSYSRALHSNFSPLLLKSRTSRSPGTISWLSACFAS
jgi:hypothetical protein